MYTVGHTVARCKQLKPETDGGDGGWGVAPNPTEGNFAPTDTAGGDWNNGNQEEPGWDDVPAQPEDPADGGGW